MKDHGYEEPRERKYDSVMTVKEMMDYLNISKTYAYLLLERKEIPFLRFGKTYRILKEDLDDYCRKKRGEQFRKSRKS